VSGDGLLHAKAASHGILRTHQRAAGFELIFDARRQSVTGSCWPLTDDQSFLLYAASTANMLAQTMIDISSVFLEDSR
jgi:hypothetical protein